MDRYSTHTRFFVAGLVGLVWLSGWTACESTIESMRENEDLIYSIHGFLDASADTQWVRVMPFRKEFLPADETLNAVVTLEHLGSGRVVELNDSLFRYGPSFAWNYWTDEPIEPEVSYRLRAERSDGRKSEVIVTMPEDYPLPVVNMDDLIEEDQEILMDQVFIEGVENMAYLQVLFQVGVEETNLNRYYRFNVIDELSITANPNVKQLTLNRRGFDPAISLHMDPLVIFPLNRNNLWDIVRLERRQIHVIAGGPDWVDFKSLELAEIELPEGVSNVENGLGYVGGVISKTIPYEQCRDPETSELIACPEVEPIRQRDLINLKYQK